MYKECYSQYDENFLELQCICVCVCVFIYLYIYIFYERLNLDQIQTGRASSYL